MPAVKNKTRETQLNKRIRARRFLLQPVVAVIAAASFSTLTAQADTTSSDKPKSFAQVALQPQPTGPSVNNEAYKKLRAQCDSEVPAGKASGEICVEAAAILVSNDLPDEFREFKEDQRIKIALRLLERGVDSSDVARAPPFDLYNQIGFLGVNSYSDPYRAQELMDMMVKNAYAGGSLRKIRSHTTLLSFNTPEAEKRAGCTSAKTQLAAGKLDAESAVIAREIVGSVICTNYDQAPK